MGVISLVNSVAAGVLLCMTTHVTKSLMDYIEDILGTFSLSICEFKASCRAGLNFSDRNKVEIIKHVKRQKSQEDLINEHARKKENNYLSRVKILVIIETIILYIQYLVQILFFFFFFFFFFKE